jgi:diadenosine tetraphosphatase ApaH/serine/threonine PP2A family protein phosphatase
MPARIEIAPGISCIHESPVPVDSGGYVRSTRIAGPVLQNMPGDVCFIGHTHVPAAFMLERDASATSVRRYVPFAGTTLTLRKQDRYLLNPGSVGQPRDGDWRASWGLLDLDRKEFSLHRVGYQVGRAQLAFSSAGLPSVLGERLRIGA